MKLKTPEEKWRFFYKRTKTLRLLGCWPLYGKKDTKFELVYTWLSIGILSNIFLSTCLIIMATLMLMEERGKFDEEVCEQIILFIISFQILSKMTVMAYKARHLTKLINKLSWAMQKKFVIKTPDIEIMNECRKYDHKLSKFFLTLSILLYISSMTRPLANTLKRMHKARAFNNGTAPVVIGELPSRYPFTLHANSYWYAFWYLQQMISVFLGAMNSWVADSMFCGFLNYLCGHFDILANNIQKDEEDYYGDNVENIKDKIKNKLKRVVEQHLYLFNFTREFKRAFAPLIVVQLLLGAITIGLQMIQIVMIKNRSLFVYAKPMVYLSLKLVQLYIASWHGQLLWDRSLQVCDACYASPWYTKPKSWSLSLKIIMMRSRRPIKVEVGSIFRFSAETFAGILNTAYSYFAMFRTVNSKSK